MLQVITDIHDECTKHGTVLRVVVPRPPVPAESAELIDTESYGKAFVQFLDLDGAKKVGNVVLVLTANSTISIEQSAAKVARLIQRNDLCLCVFCLCAGTAGHQRPHVCGEYGGGDIHAAAGLYGRHCAATRASGGLSHVPPV